jgi:hypothetical protein
VPNATAVELQDALTDLKRQIQDSVIVAVARFEERTGLTPNDINVRMIDATTHADVLRRSLVGRVEVSLGDF